MRTDLPTPASSGRILVKANYQIVPVNLSDILFIKALSDYVIIKTTHGKHITLSTMKEMAESLPEGMFARAHRSFIVNLNRVRCVRGNFIEICDKGMEYSIPIGRAYRKEVRASLVAA